MDDIVNKFLKKYEAQAGMSKRMYSKYERHPFDQYSYKSMDVYDYKYNVRQEPYVEMYIPQHQFQELIERDNHLNEMAKQTDYAMAKLNQLMEEESIRSRNPAVKKAYEKYRTLLELSRT